MAGFGRSKGEAGERWFQRVLLAGCLLVLAGLGLIALYLVLRQTRPDDIYFELQRQASFVYLGFWAAIALVGGLLALMRRTEFLGLYVVLLLAAERAAHVYFYPQQVVLSAHLSRSADASSPSSAGGLPRPRTCAIVPRVLYPHLRTLHEAKLPKPTLIAALGGSTTYDIGNADDATWPSDLSKLLGKDYAVENLGVPGYSSLENLIQSLFAFRDRRPACAIYYVGWNDLHTAHVKDLRSDYSDYQLPSQIGNLAVGRRSGFLENNMLLLRMILSVFATPERQAQGRMSGESDPRLSQIFSENMRLIADIDRHFGVKAIFVPQVLDYARFKDAGSSGWIPLVPDKDVKTVMQALNQDLAAVAKETGTLFLDKPLSVAWQNSDFVDQGHFSAAGAKKFAEAIAGDIAANCQPGPGAQ
jgi:lysophospholipase L1-like esterase